MPTSSDKLVRCKQLFDSWRKLASKKREKRIIPDSLWKEAIQLIGSEFTISRVAAELGLNQARLREKQIELNSLPSKKKIEKQPTRFIQLKNPVAFSTQTASSDLRLSIERADGTSLTLSIPQSESAEALRLFSSYLSRS